MKLCVYSDLHLEFEDFDPDHCRADIVVLAGDIHLGQKAIPWIEKHFKSIPVVYVLGNHEYYGQTYPKLLRKLKAQTENTNIHILENDVINVEGVDFFGCTLWTDFELFGDPKIAGYECQQVMTDFKKIRREPNYSKIRSIDIAIIHKQSLRWLRETVSNSTAKKKVIVTHHAPSIQSVSDKYKNKIVTAAYASNLEKVVEEMGPDLWLHGHLHSSSDYCIGSTRVICNPRGYSGERNPEFNFEFVLEI